MLTCLYRWIASTAGRKVKFSAPLGASSASQVRTTCMTPYTGASPLAASGVEVSPMRILDAGARDRC